ncbi:hypothetical protein DD559_08550 [Sphingomonas pokkalii]|uniref:Uncharacterized protein n=2 Tax=Sphingomonas pokkalii TaxID=2175090 RepID=A0A2U0SDJ3_9SPHN|nr:hypothetical protein DD559_08550 [Sphingomonas pokkalii]
MMESVMSVIEIDTDKVKASAASFKANPPAKSEVAADPQAFLAKFGVTIDSEFSEQIRSRLASVEGGAAQSASVHVDF